MMFKTKRQKRVAMVVGALCLLVALVVSVMVVLRQNIEWYLTPTECEHYPAIPGEVLHLGGVVQKHSIRHQENMNITFALTDFDHVISVRYHGILPGLFREGKGAVLTGHMGEDHVFEATQVLAKHDENYRPVTRKKHAQ